MNDILFTIGGILFKNARDLTNEETIAMEDYLNTKVRKICKEQEDVPKQYEKLFKDNFRDMLA